MNVRTTLADVAKRANCSKSTVSLALRNDPRIPAATRERVQAFARELNYRPDPALAFIAACRWQTRSTPSGSVIAFITTSHPNGNLLDDDALPGAREQAEELGYRLEHFRAEDYQNPAHLGRVIQHRGIRGVIMGKLMREDYVTQFPWSDFCGVACDTGFYKPPLHLVMPDHSHAVKRAFCEAYLRGYRRIGMILFDEPNAIDDFDKVSAFLYCASFLPDDLPRIPVAHVAPGDDAAAMEWFKRFRPDCVLGLNPYIAHMLRRGGVRLPEQSGFVALMGPTEVRADRQAIHPASTTLDHCPQLLGRIAIQQIDIVLRNNLAGNPSHPVTMMVEAAWVEGDTLPARRKGRNVPLEMGEAARPSRTDLARVVAT